MNIICHGPEQNCQVTTIGVVGVTSVSGASLMRRARWDVWDNIAIAVMTSLCLLSLLVCLPERGLQHAVLSSWLRNQRLVTLDRLWAILQLWRFPATHPVLDFLPLLIEFGVILISVHDCFSSASFVPKQVYTWGVLIPEKNSQTAVLDATTSWFSHVCFDFFTFASMFLR